MLMNYDRNVPHGLFLRFQVVLVNDVLFWASRAVLLASDLRMANNNIVLECFNKKSMFFYSHVPKTRPLTPSWPLGSSKNEHKRGGMKFRWIRYEFYI